VAGSSLDAATVRDAALQLFAERGYRATTMADIGAALGIRGPSLYRHVTSKQDLLAAIMTDTMRELIARQRAAAAAGGDPAHVLRRMVEAHVRFHAANREQAFVGNREIDNLQPANRAPLLELRHRYADGLRAAIAAGRDGSVFRVASDQLAAYAILDMGIGVSTWFRADGPHSADEVAYTYADYALAMLMAGTSPGHDTVAGIKGQ
jgi:AcrR family transcriptional regulator